MPRHRARSAKSRVLTTVAVAGAALGTSVLAPADALASPAGETGGQLAPGAQLHHHHHDAKSKHAPRTHRRHRSSAMLRPMTSGEEQYRNGCRHGYITDDCGQFSVNSLLGKGINPTL